MTRAVPLGLLFVRPNYAKGIHVFCCAVCYRRGILLDVNLFYLFPIYITFAMSLSTSPRLPNVPLLLVDSTGPEYSRWRRRIQFACEAKGTWGYCSGAQPMPMPESGPTFMPPSLSIKKDQPSLLEERRAWVRQDREVKLDIFLSLSEEVMDDVFHVGPPLPPSNLKSQEMLEALDKRFMSFRFEDFHHAFCHFLNLHLEQYTTLEEFNAEFQATLEDLLDHGHALSNAQACSAYFSKMRCTQNPWVVQKLQRWHSGSSEPMLEDLMKESPPWSTILPLVSKPSMSLKAESIPEEYLDDSSVPSSDSEGDTSSVSTRSSISKQHSRQTSNTTTHSLEITIHASSSDIEELARFPAVPTNDIHPSQRLRAKQSMPLMPLMPLPAPINRPLPPLPAQAMPTERSRSVEPPRKSSPRISPPPTPPFLRLETTHPTLRPQTPGLIPTPQLVLDQKEFGTQPTPSPSSPAPDSLHPALRGAAAPTPQAQRSAPAHLVTFAPQMNLPVPWPSTPDRPHSSRADMLDVVPMSQTTVSASASTPSLALNSTTQAPALPTVTHSLFPRPLLPHSRTAPSATPVPTSARTQALDNTSTPARGIVGRLSVESVDERNVKKTRKKSWSMGMAGLGRFAPGKGVKEIV
jgi:hypothetical protein